MFVPYSHQTTCLSVKGFVRPKYPTVKTAILSIKHFHIPSNIESTLLVKIMELSVFLACLPLVFTRRLTSKNAEIFYIGRIESIIFIITIKTSNYLKHVNMYMVYLDIIINISHVKTHVFKQCVFGKLGSGRTKGLTDKRTEEQ